MSKKVKDNQATTRAPAISKEAYKESVQRLQVELVKLQRHIIKGNEKILVILEGRDSSGKDETIKRIIEHLSPRETRVVALGKRADRDRTSWYFQRYIAQLPAAQECVLFNRSWYNRAGVEHVMGFRTEAAHEEFLGSVSKLLRSGVTLLKYYLDISKAEQQKRLKARGSDPLKQWKISPIDNQALKNWRTYSRARNEMLARSHSAIAPWTLVRANHKRLARLNVIRDLLGRQQYTHKNPKLIHPDPRVVFTYDPANLTGGQLAN